MIGICITPGISSRIGKGGQVAASVIAKSDLAVGLVIDRGQTSVLIVELKITPAERFGGPVEFATSIGVIETKTLFVAPGLQCACRVELVYGLVRTDGRRGRGAAVVRQGSRSEERRVGKECRSRWS